LDGRDGRQITPFGDGRPDGVPVGREIERPPRLLAEDLYLAVRSINQVHGDGVLPLVPILLRTGLMARGSFAERGGTPISIVIRAESRHRGFALVHEVGHLLDFAGIGTAGRYASESNHPSLAVWKQAVFRSDAVQRLIHLVGEVASLLPVAESARVFDAREFLEPAELWARSYAQYVALQSGDSNLIAALTAARTPNPAMEYYPTQWSDEDFLPIGGAIEDLFRRIGWRTDRTG
jgi:hypothetical protein